MRRCAARSSAVLIDRARASGSLVRTIAAGVGGGIGYLLGGLLVVAGAGRLYVL